MRKMFITIAATAAMGLAAPAFAQDGNNGRQNREQARQNSQGPANANQRGKQRANENSVLSGGGMSNSDRMRRDRQMRDGQKRDGQMKDREDMEQNSMRRKNSQGRTNSSDRARERANQNSAIQSGMMVHDRNNRMVGRVRDVRRAPDGTVIAIVVVLVVQVNGTSVITLPAGSFTIINNIVIVNNINLTVGG